jgi:hypothetical protein
VSILYIARFIYRTLFCTVFVISMGEGGGAEEGGGNLYFRFDIDVITISLN